MGNRYSDDELLDHLRTFAADLGRSPTMAEMDERGEYAADTYRRRFGSWNDALRRADLEVNRTRDIPVEDLLDELRRLAAELGRPPLATDVRRRGEYSLGTYGSRFDSWVAALEAAGFTGRGTPASESSTLEHLRANGPTPVEKLPDGAPTTGEKMRGAATFALDAPATAAVAYLLDEHEEEAVLRVLFDHNPDLVEEFSLHNLMQVLGDHGRSWQAAARTVLHEYI